MPKIQLSALSFHIKPKFAPATLTRLFVTSELLVSLQNSGTIWNEMIDTGEEFYCEDIDIAPTYCEGKPCSYCVFKRLLAKYS